MTRIIFTAGLLLFLVTTAMTARAQTDRAFPYRPEGGYNLIPSGYTQGEYLPKAGVKVNLLYLATTTLNAALEFGLAPKWTLDIIGNLNPWDLDGHRRGIRHALIQPEARYWFCQRFERHFIGMHALYGVYQIEDIYLRPFVDLRGMRYDGWGAGVGLSYGYHLAMGRSWGWEFTLGVGYVYLDYEKYNRGDCDTFLGSATGHYFGPTKAGISLIYMFR